MDNDNNGLVVDEPDSIRSSNTASRIQAVEGSDGSSSTLSKNKFRKQRVYEKMLANRKLKRDKERSSRKSKPQRRIHKDEKLATVEKLRKSLETGAKVAIDCQYDKQMSIKEQKHFAQQLRRVYASNKAADNPLHLYFTSLSENSEFYNICMKQNDGFAKYIVDTSEKNVLELFSSEKVVYLSPDSPNVLEKFDATSVYVIGGLVDETTTKNISLTFCENKNLSSARLPIDEYFERAETGTYKKVLTVNQIVDIILEFYINGNWVSAIKAGLPERTGFIPKKTPEVVFANTL